MKTATSIFHCDMVIRRRNNTIRSLKTNDGKVVDSQNDIKTEFLTYFKSIWSPLTSSPPPFDGSVIPQILTNEDEALTREVTMK